MKMVKSLLLGSAAGLVAVTAGQAADLPVKAKPVEYVKICSLYGAGFYYMPGTDLCIKIGGWTRAEVIEGGNGNSTWGPFNANANQRTTNNLTFKFRGYITADVRNQTEYGTVRGYIAVGASSDDNGFRVVPLQDNINRLFVQWAGMTAGLSQSFYDFYSPAAVTYRGGYYPSSDTGDGGWWVWAYTAQFGGGFSGTISAEARRNTQIIDANCLAAVSSACGTVTPGGYPAAATVGGVGVTGAGGVFPGGGAYGGMQSPDVVANLRVDQTWGGAQVMGALHEVNASYYGAGIATGPSAASLAHPSDAWGWAAGVGLKLNLPMITQGDWFQAQVNASQGALRYLFQTPNTNWGMARGTDAGGGTEGYGVLSDCVFGGTPAVVGTTTSCQLTSAWGVNASFEHFWTPALHSSLYGAWYQVKYGASANNMLCTNEGMGIGGLGGGAAAVAAPGCNNNWSTYAIGSRTQWDVTKTFYLGVEVMYEKLQSASTSTGLLPGAPLAFAGAGATTAVANQSNWNFTLRAHRDFLP